MPDTYSFDKGSNDATIAATLGGLPVSVPVLVRDSGEVVQARSNRRENFTDSVVALAAAATFTGLMRDSGAGPDGPAFALVRAFADQAGTLFLEQSRDNAVWRFAAADSVAVAANEVKLLRVPLVARYWRVRFLNGATLQAAFELVSGTSEH